MTNLDHLFVRRQVTRLLDPWQHANGPGVTIGVVLGQELVVHESAGMASVELGVPIGPATTFRIASVSKQFTCAAILLLRRRASSHSTTTCATTSVPCQTLALASLLRT